MSAQHGTPSPARAIPHLRRVSPRRSAPVESVISIHSKRSTATTIPSGVPQSYDRRKNPPPPPSVSARVATPPPGVSSSGSAASGGDTAYEPRDDPPVPYVNYRRSTSISPPAMAPGVRNSDGAHSSRSPSHSKGKGLMTPQPVPVYTQSNAQGLNTTPRPSKAGHQVPWLTDGRGGPALYTQSALTPATHGDPKVVHAFQGVLDDGHALRAAVADLERELSEYRRRQHELEQDNLHLREALAQVGPLEQEVLALKDEVGKGRRADRSAEEARKKDRAAMRELENRIRALREELHREQEERRRMRAGYEEALALKECQLADLEAQSRGKRDLAELEQRVNDLRGQLAAQHADAEESRRMYDGGLEKQAMRIRDLTSELRDALHENQKLKSEVLQWERQAAGRDERVQRLQEQLQEQVHKASVPTAAALREAKESLVDLQERLKAAEAAATEGHEAAAKQAAERRVLQIRCAELENEMQRATQQLQTAAERVAQAEARAHSAEQRRDELEEVFDQRALAAARRLQERDDELRALRDELERVQGDKEEAALRAELEQEKGLREAAECMVAKLQRAGGTGDGDKLKEVERKIAAQMEQQAHVVAHLEGQVAAERQLRHEAEQAVLHERSLRQQREAEDSDHSKARKAWEEMMRQKEAHHDAATEGELRQSAERMLQKQEERLSALADENRLLSEELGTEREQRLHAEKMLLKKEETITELLHQKMTASPAKDDHFARELQKERDLRLKSEKMLGRLKADFEVLAQKVGKGGTEELQMLQEAVQRLKEERDLLAAEGERLVHEKHRAVSQCDDLSAECERLAHEKEAVQQQLRERDSLVHGLRDDVASLQLDVEEHRTVQKEADRLRGEVEDLRGEVQRLEDDKGRLQGSVKALQRREEEKEEELQSLTARLQGEQRARRVAVDDLQKEIDELAVSKGILHDEVTSLKRKLQEASIERDDLEALQGENTRLRVEHRKAAARAQEAEQEKELLEAKLERLRKEDAGTEGRNAELLAENDTMRAQARAKDNELKRLRSECEELRGEAEALRGSVAAQSAEVRRLKAIEDDLQAEVLQLRRSRAQDAEVAGLREEVDRLGEETLRRKKEYAELQREKERVDDDLSGARQTVAELRRKDEEARKAQKALQHLEDELTALRRERDGMEQERKGLVDERDKLRDVLDHAARDVARLNRENDVLGGDVVDLRQKVVLLQEEIMPLQRLREERWGRDA
eukprot:Sspe_Gene.44216::Locus_21665_Transcript_1_1_Confidence_1.000_Length_3729::g.44216::m.44216